MRHQPPGGQHSCMRCGRRNGFSSALWSISSTLCRWSRCFTTLCRRWWNSGWTFSHLLDFHVAEQVIEVPKIECPSRAARTVEQLVEVPTPVSYSSLFQRTVEQNVDNPAAGGSGAGGGLFGSLSGQNSAALWNRSVDIPSGGRLQGFQRGQSSTAFMEQITVSPNSRSRSSTFSTSPGLRSVFFGFSWTRWRRGFSHFLPNEKSATLPASALEPMDAVSL